MRQALLFSLYLLLAQWGYSQKIARRDSVMLSRVEQMTPNAKHRLERRLNMYSNRKYSYGVSETLYGFSKNATIYHAADVNFSDRLKGLDIDDFASFEFTGGASFQPYQGFRLHFGFDYEWLTPAKVHLYAGVQYAQGLKQNTIASNSLSSVMVGNHSYIVPFMGLMYWPGKRDVQRINRLDSAEKAKLRNPTFWQLVYVKGQAGYSALLSRLAVYPSESYDKTITGNIRKNISSGLYLSIGVGVNLPSFGNTKLIDFDLLHRLNAY